MYQKLLKFIDFSCRYSKNSGARGGGLRHGVLCDMYICQPMLFIRVLVLSSLHIICLLVLQSTDKVMQLSQFCLFVCLLGSTMQCSWSVCDSGRTLVHLVALNLSGYAE